MKALFRRTNLFATIICTTAILVSFLVNGSSLHAGSAPVLTLSDANTDLDVSWINVADKTDVLSTEGNTEASIRGMKDPEKAMRLGGLLGFGSGLFYSKRYVSGTSFAAIDTFCLLFAGIGIIGAATQDEDEFLHELGSAVGYTVGGVCITGLVISHTVQAFWSRSSARKYNEELKYSHWQPFVAPTKHSAMLGVTYRF